MTRLRTPIVTVITGEGGSGGALAIAVGDVIIALENAVYSVISPEGCASILWRTSDEAATAAARSDDARLPTTTTPTGMLCETPFVDPFSSRTLAALPPFRYRTEPPTRSLQTTT